RRSTAPGCSASCETSPVNLRKRGCSLSESICVYHARAAEGEVFGRFASHMISSYTWVKAASGLKTVFSEPILRTGSIRIRRKSYSHNFVGYLRTEPDKNARSDTSE